MRVLHLFKAYPPVTGGIEYHVRLLAEAQRRRACEVTVLAASAEGPATDTDENGIRVIRTRAWGRVASTPLSPGLVRWLRRLKPDVAHLHFPYPFGELAHQLFGRAPVTIVTYHSDPVRYPRLRPFYAPVMRRLLGRADRILATTRPYLESSAALRPVADRCEVVPLGIDPAPYLAVDPDRVAAARGDVGAMVLFVGRLRHYKGVEVLIDAATSVDARVAIVGAGPMRERWERQAAGSPAADRIRFLGYQTDAELPAHYAAADVVVLPSVDRSEAFGQVLVEAMAAGRPVVSTELGTGTSVVNQQGKTGLVVPPSDPDALAAALNALLADPARRAAMGAAGRQRVMRHYHVDTMADRTVAIYRAALDRRRAAAAPAAELSS